MPILYEKAPLVEAVFELFVEDPSWSASTVERLDRIFKGDFPGVEEVRNFNYEIRFTPDGPEHRPATQANIHRRWRADRQRLVQYSSQMCAFNALKPYTKFVDYLPTIQKLFRAYLAETKPGKVKYLGQRYINRITIPAGARPSDYFTFYPDLKAQNIPGVFGMQLETSRLANGRVVMNLALQSQPGNPPEYVLDLYARTDDLQPIAPQWAEIEAWNTAAHNAIETSFEGVLQPKAQEMLGRREL